MGIIERRQREKERIRTTILEAAWTMVKKEGWQSLSIRRIADAVEYSVPVIYDYFENKEELLIEFAKEGFRILAKKIQLAKAKKREPGRSTKTNRLCPLGFCMQVQRVLSIVVRAWNAGM